MSCFEEGDRSRPNARLTADIVARARDKGLILALLRAVLQRARRTLAPGLLASLKIIRRSATCAVWGR